MSKNIKNSKINYNSILNKFMISLKINKKLKNDNKYGKPGASNKIYNILRKINFKNILLKKEFYDN